MAINVEVIWVKRTPEYFCEKGWTGSSVICPAGAIGQPRLQIFTAGSNTRAVPPLTGTA